MVRRYTTFRWKEASLRICCPRADRVTGEIRRQRAVLEEYIRRQPEFLSALGPLELLEEAPPIVRRMHAASLATGVGPMAAVAGAMAQAAAEAALAAGAQEAIVENGGDIYLVSPREVTVGLYTGANPLSGRLAFRVPAAGMPLSICSSSGRFGHSMSFGDCDLATVVAPDGALADAAATLAANSVRSAGDVAGTLERVAAIPGIQGVLIVQEGTVGLIGDLPDLVRAAEPDYFHQAAGGETIFLDQRQGLRL